MSDGSFAYVAIILDAWSHRVAGYAIGPHRPGPATALKVASRDVAAASHEMLAANAVVGSWPGAAIPYGPMPRPRAS
jgi:hypothetical protein